MCFGSAWICLAKSPSQSALRHRLRFDLMSRLAGGGKQSGLRSLILDGHGPAIAVGLSFLPSRASPGLADKAADVQVVYLYVY